MTFEIVSKDDVMNLLKDEDLYVLRYKTAEGTIRPKYCTGRPLVGMTVRELTNALSSPVTAIIRIKDEA